MPSEEKRWLTLAEASKLLGVHPATLRVWADAGEAPSYRTPGGHRRFEAGELRSFLMKASTAATAAGEKTPEAVLIETALAKARTDLRSLPPDAAGWHTAFDEAGRDHLRSLGRQLCAAAIQYVNHAEQRADALRQGKQIGQDYAASALHYHISLLETVRAFQYFRQSLLRSLMTSEPAPLAPAHDDLSLRQNADAFLNEALYGLIDAYEHMLLNAAPGGAVPP